MADQITRLTAELAALAAMAKQVQAQMSGLGGVGQGGVPAPQAFRPYEVLAAASMARTAAALSLPVPLASTIKTTSIGNQQFKGVFSHALGSLSYTGLELHSSPPSLPPQPRLGLGPWSQLAGVGSPRMISSDDPVGPGQVQRGPAMRMSPLARQILMTTGYDPFTGNGPHQRMYNWSARQYWRAHDAAAEKISKFAAKEFTNKLMNRGMIAFALHEGLESLKGNQTGGEMAANFAERISNVAAAVGYSKILTDGALTAKKLAGAAHFMRSAGAGRALARAYAMAHGMAAGVGAAAIVMAGANAVPIATRYAGIWFNDTGDPLDHEARKSTADAFKHVEKWGARGTWGMLLHDQTVDHLASGDRFLGMQLGDSGSMGRRFLSFFGLAKSEEELKKEATQVSAKRIQKSAEHYAEAERQAELGNVDEVHSQLGQVNSLLGVAGNVFDREKGTKAASWVQMFETQRMARRMYAAVQNARAGSRTGD